MYNIYRVQGSNPDHHQKNNGERPQLTTIEATSAPFVGPNKQINDESESCASYVYRIIAYKRK